MKTIAAKIAGGVAVVALLAGCAYAATGEMTSTPSITPSSPVATTSTPAPSSVAPVEVNAASTAPDGGARASSTPSSPSTPIPQAVAPVSAPASTATPSSPTGMATPSVPSPSQSVSTPAVKKTKASTATRKPVVKPAAKPTAKATPKPTAAPTPSAGPTGVRYSTVSLNVRKAPNGAVSTTVAPGSALELTGRVLDGWTETKKGWVSTRYLTETKPVAPKPTPTAVTKPAPKPAAESVQARCDRLWAKAKTYIASSTTTACASVPNGQGQAGWSGKSFEDGTFTATAIWASIDPKLMAKRDDERVVALMVHELAHTRYYAASRDAKAAHAKVLDTTPANYASGTYSARPTERFADAAAQCLTGVRLGNAKSPYSCSTFNTALGALK